MLEAGRADASSVERVPFVTAVARPFIFSAGRPAAQRAADARGFRSAGLLIFLKLAVWDDDRIVGDRSHGCRSRSARCPPNTWIALVPASTSPPWRTHREESNTPHQL